LVCHWNFMSDLGAWTDIGSAA